MKLDETNEINYYIDQIERVVKYVRNFQLRSGMVECPTISRMAKSLRMKQADVLQLCEDAETLCVNIGIQIPQVGYGCYDTIGEYQIECLSDEIWKEYERRERRGRHNDV